MAPVSSFLEWLPHAVVYEMSCDAPCSPLCFVALCSTPWLYGKYAPALQPCSAKCEEMFPSVDSAQVWGWSLLRQVMFFFILTLVHIAANCRTSKAPDAMHLFLSFLVQDYLIFLDSFNSDLFHVFFVHLNSQLAHLFTWLLIILWWIVLCPRPVPHARAAACIMVWVVLLSVLYLLECTAFLTLYAQSAGPSNDSSWSTRLSLTIMVGKPASGCICLRRMHTNRVVFREINPMGYIRIMQSCGFKPSTLPLGRLEFKSSVTPCI